VPRVPIKELSKHIFLPLLVSAPLSRANVGSANESKQFACAMLGTRTQRKKLGGIRAQEWLLHAFSLKSSSNKFTERCWVNHGRKSEKGVARLLEERSLAQESYYALSCNGLE